MTTATTTMRTDTQGVGLFHIHLSAEHMQEDPAVQLLSVHVKTLAQDHIPVVLVEVEVEVEVEAEAEVKAEVEAELEAEVEHL